MEHQQANSWLAHQPRGGLQGMFLRLAAVGETLFVLLGMIVIARLVFRATGLADADSFLFGDDVVPDFRAAAVAESQWHAIRYGLVFIAVIIIGWIRQRRGRAAYGVTTGGHSISWLIAFGVGVFAIIHVPSLILRLADHYLDIGPGTLFWALMKETEWNTDFWLYMAVSSFAVVPLVEEFVARGYMLGRFRESFSPGGGLVVVALIFSSAHTQYHQADLYSIGMLLALVWGSIVMGYAVYRTGSLLPPIIAHILVNVPTSIAADYVIIVLIALTMFLFRGAFGVNARRLWAILRSVNDWPSLAMIGVVIVAFGMTLQATPWAPYAWLGGFFALFVASLFVKSKWSE
ncbi:MAG: CPBP family intramembrane glutamic endopeptidase [Pseudomonadota bacterium]